MHVLKETLGTTLAIARPYEDTVQSFAVVSPKAGTMCKFLLMLTLEGALGENFQNILTPVL